MRILVVTGEAYPGHELRNSKLAGELSRRGHHVRHAVPMPELVDDGFTRAPFQPDQLPLLSIDQVKPFGFKSWRQLNDLILWSDVVVFGTSKAYFDAASFARSLGRVVVQHRDIGSLDPWVLDCDILAVRSSWEFDSCRLGRNIRLPHPFPITGSTQFDDAAPVNRRLDRVAICRKYGLDAGKKIAIFFPGSPATHTELFRRTYVSIIETVQANENYQVVIKPHPADYAGLKQNQNYSNTSLSTWEQIAPGTPVCLPDDKYDLMATADLFLARQSTIVFETALFCKPMVFIDYPEMWLSEPGDDWTCVKRCVSSRRWQPPGRKAMTCLGALEGHTSEIDDASLRQRLEKLGAMVGPYWGQASEYIGTEITLEELPWLLEDENRWRFDEAAVYEDYVLRHCHANDGLAYMRVADAVEQAASYNELKARLRLIWLKRPVQHALKSRKRAAGAFLAHLARRLSN